MFYITLDSEKINRMSKQPQLQHTILNLINKITWDALGNAIWKCIGIADNICKKWRRKLK